MKVCLKTPLRRGSKKGMSRGVIDEADARHQGPEKKRGREVLIQRSSFRFENTFSHTATIRREAGAGYGRE